MTDGRTTPDFRELESLIDQVKAEWSRSDLPKSPLYHYSSVDGCIGVLCNQSLWASSFESMNDQGELRHGLDLWTPKCKDLIVRITQVNAAQAQLLKGLSDFFDAERSNPSVRPFIASFTTEADSPSQWLAYGDRGYGGVLEVLFERISGNSILLPVLYDDSAKTALIDSAIKDIEDFISKYQAVVAPRQAKKFLELIVLALVQIMLIHSARMKAIGWKHEQEWRLITFVNSKAKSDPAHGGIKYRSRQSILMDFLEVNLSRAGGKVSGIGVGPKVPTDSLHSWSLLWSASGHAMSPIRRSKVAVG